MAKNRAKAKQHPEAALLLFGNYSHLDPPYHPKIIEHILKNKQKNKCFCIHEIIRLIPMKIKNRSYRYKINRPRSRHKHKYSKNKKCLSMIILLCIKQQLKFNS